MPRLTSNKAQGILESLGISLVDDQNNMRDVMQIYTEVAQKIQGISDVSKMEVYEGLAGKYHISRLTALLDDLGSVDSMYKNMYESSKNSAGSAMDENEKYMKSLQARINLARVEVEKLALAIGGAFLTEGMIQGLKVFGDFLSLLTKFTDKFGALPVMFGTAGAALFILSSRFRGLASAIAMTITSQLGFTTATRASTAATAAAAASTDKFKWSLRGLAAASGVGLVLVGVGVAMEALFGHMAKTREMSEKIATDNKALMDSYGQNKQTINNLTAEYATLEEAMKFNPNVTTQEKYYAVQNELAGLMPALVKGEDSYGNKLLGNSSVIESRIALVERQVEAEKALQDAQDSENTAEKIKTQEKLIEQQKAAANIALLNIKDQTNGGLFTNESNKYEFSDQIKGIQDMEKALTYYYERKKTLEAQGLDKASVGEENDSIIKSLEKNIDNYIAATSQMESAQAYLTSTYASTASKIIQENAKMSDSTKGMATDILYDLSLVEGGAKEFESVADVFSGIEMNSELTEALKTMDSEISTLTENAETDFSKLEASATKSFGSVKNSILAASGLKVGSDAYVQLASGIDTYINKLMVSESSIRAEAAAQGISVEASRAAAAAHDETGAALDNETMERYELKDAIDQLSGASQNLITDSDELLFMHEMQTAALATLRQGTDEYTAAEEALAGTKQNLINLYPHLFSAEKGALALTDEKIEAVRAEVEAQDVLRAAYKAAMDGKLSTEHNATVANLAQTNSRIKNINTEISALQKLANAYYGAENANYERVLKAAKAGEEGAASALMRMTRPIGAIQMLQAELATAISSRSAYVSDLIKIPEVMERSTTRSNKAISESQKEYEKATKESTAAQKKNNEAIEKSTYLANKYKQALEKVTLALEKQKSITEDLPDYSKAYRDSLEKEIKLQKDKKKLLEDQAKSLEDQIKKGEIIRYGVTTTQSGTSGSSNQPLSGWGGRVTSNYGYRNDPFTGRRKWHAGTDIAGAKGTRLDANVAGKVTFAGNAGNGFGNYVMVQAENGIKHIYAHLNKVAVKIGDKVARGMKLGEIGSTGNSTGSHLHYETRNSNNKSFDSKGYLNQAKSAVTTSVAGAYSGKYATEINKAAQTYGVDPNLIAAMIKQESGFNPRAVSHAGAKGLMQLMPGTAKDLGVKDSFNAQQNIMGGTKYIAQQLKAFGGNLAKALAAYNAGPGNVRKHGGIPPFKETQNYVKKVTANYNALGGGNGRGSAPNTADIKYQNQVSKDAAETKAAIDDARSQINSLRGEINDTESLIQDLEGAIINSNIAKYEKQIEYAQKAIDLEVAKREAGNLTDDAFHNSLKYQQYQTGLQKKAQEDELAYLNKLRKSTKLTAKTKSELKDKALDLTTSIRNLKNEMQALQSEIVNFKIDNFEEKFDSLQSKIDNEAGLSEKYDQSQEKYQNSLRLQISLSKSQIKVLQDEKDFIDRVKKSALLSAKAKEELALKSKELSESIQKLQLSVKNLTFERIQTTMRRFEEQLDDVAYALDLISGKLKTLDKDSAEYTQEMKNQIPLLEKQKNLLIEQRESLQRSLLIHDLTPEKVKEITEKIEDLGKSIWDVEGAIVDVNNELKDIEKQTIDNLADALIEAYKSYIEEKRAMHEKSLEKEMKAEDERHEKVTKNLQDELEGFRKIVQARIDEIDRQESEKNYAEEIDELEADRMETLNKINLLSLDNSLEAKAERKELQESLDEIDKNIADKRHAREIEERKENLNGMIEDKEKEVSEKEELENKLHEDEKKRIDDLKEYWNQFYTDQLNDEERFAKLREDIVAGNFDALSAEFQGFMDEMKETMPDLENTLGGTMEAVGTSIRENIIKTIQEALDMLKEVQEKTNAGIDNGADVGAASKLSAADLKVIGGKFLNDRLATMEESDPRRANIKEKGYALAKEGRAEGSTLATNVGFDKLIAGYSEDDKKKIASYFSTNLPKELISPYLQDFIKEYAGQIGGTADGQNLITTADLKVIGAKFMNDRLTQMETNPVRREKIREKGHALADEGRGEGSTIKSSSSFNDIIAGYSNSDKKIIGQYFQNFLPKTLMTPYLQEYIADFSKNLMGSSIGFDTGGYTGKFSGGKLATLHEEELVLNKKHTKDYFKAASIIENLQALINPLKMSSIKQPELASANGGNQPININFNVENMNATQKEADSFASRIQNQLRRVKGVK